MASLTDCQWRLGELLLCDKAVQKSVGPHTAPTFPPTSSIEDPQGYIPGIIEVPVFVLQEQCWMLGLFALMNRCCYIGAILSGVVYIWWPMGSQIRIIVVSLTITQSPSTTLERFHCRWSDLPLFLSKLSPIL